MHEVPCAQCIRRHGCPAEVPCIPAAPALCDQGRAFRASVKAVDVNQPWCRSSVAAYAALAAAARLRLLLSCMRCSSSTMKCMALHTASAQN